MKLSPQFGEQLRLFDTHTVGGRGEIYATLPSDESKWADRDIEVPYSPAVSSERSELEVLGSFRYGPSTRDELGAQIAHGVESRMLPRRGVEVLGGRQPQVAPGLQFGDLIKSSESYTAGRRSRADGSAVTTYSRDDGTEVGKVKHRPSEWGTLVEHAEIVEPFRGKGFSRDAIVDFARDHSGPGRGVVHSAMFSADGERAFGAKGIPTEDQLRDAHRYSPLTQEEYVSQKLEPAQERVLSQLLPDPRRSPRRSSFDSQVSSARSAPATQLRLRL